MAIQDDKTILSKADLKEYHNRILPYLGGNMMMSTNNSDYYSTDEKVVGVWTDGRPIYQKTVTGTTPSASGLVAVAPTTAREIIKAEGKLVDVNRWIVYSTNYVEGDKPQTFGIGADRDTGYKLWFQVGSACVSRPYTLTLQYTKTTDTASTALTTPGAYDINFPNTWPANKEIFFGNGVYGYRATGTITVAKNVPDNTVIMTGLQNGSIINWGGNWIDGDGNQMGTGSYKGETVQSLIQLNKTQFNGQLFFSTNDNTGARTNAPYDIWVTYTK